MRWNCTVYIGNFARHATIEGINAGSIIVRMARQSDFDYVVTPQPGEAYIVDEENNLNYNVSIPAHGMGDNLRVNFARR